MIPLHHHKDNIHEHKSTVNCPTCDSEDCTQKCLLVFQLEAENRLKHRYAVHQVADPIIKSMYL